MTWTWTRRLEGVAVSCAWAVAACGDDKGAAGTAGGGDDTSASSTLAASSGSSSSGSSGAGGQGAWGAAGSWSFTKFPDREFRGQTFEGAWVASDPCVLRDGATYRMFYTCVGGAEVGGLCQVTSPDGIGWTPAPSIDPAIDGLVARGRPGEGWDENIETCAIAKRPSRYELYYSGYPDLDEVGARGPAALGVMTSTDGDSFTRDPDAEPVLAPVPGSPDGDDIFSAVAVESGDALDFVYVGWCIDGYHDGVDCDEGPGVQLLGATRLADGTWTRRSEPVLTARPDIAWMQNGVAEPDVVLGPDGSYYLFFTGGLGDEPRVMGVAVGPTPFGPWEIAPDPVLEGDPGAFDACGAFAPSVLVEGDVVRMWYLGIDDCDGTCPDCDFESCGCDERFTIGYAEAACPSPRP